MRAAAILLLLSRCASSDGLVRNEIMGGPGQDIAVGIVDVDTSLDIIDREGSRQYTVQLEVTNMTDVPLTVDRIVIKASQTDSPFRVQGTSRRFNEMVDPGKDRVFPLALSGRLVREFQRDERRVFEFDVIVELTNGDSYFYTFEGPVRDLEPRRF
jgi:hypothetical protein